ncbi:MAG: M48 family metalloprotease [Candidatus Eremiobacteraeota bacterium]|nr:M48 family metalloprotease [Candidatus Eremiobacteraeota bacterium]MBV9645849.1 M48 family metalloprotease [Candidatus Eremiobacteraeota bacterium]
MQRQVFLHSLIGAVGVSQFARIAPALALDEGQIGREVFLDLRDGGDLLFDSPYYEHLNEVGEIVAMAVRPRYPYPIRYYVVKGDSANAFSVPGGNIYVNEPLLKLVKNRDELGGVLGHETGHMVLHHVARSIKNSETAGILGTIGSIAAQILLGPIGAIPANYALDIATSAQDLNLSRHIEAQADEEGARILASTNSLNPYGMIWFFETMKRVYGSHGAYWEQSHPFDDQRITDLLNEFKKDPATFGKFKSTKPENDVYW